MIGAVVLMVSLWGVNQLLLTALKKKHKFLAVSFLNKLYIYHLIFWLIYYLYATFNASDSKQYYARGGSYENWLSAYGTDSKFIHFVSYPFIKTIGFSYESTMVLFSWFGFLGFVYFYLFFKENNKLNVKFKGYDLITLVLFLPNMHFWTASLGKGSLIFMGIGMFAYAMKTPHKRVMSLLLGSFVVYNIRPHMFLFLAVGAIVGYFTGKEKVPLYQKLLVYVAFAGGTFLLMDNILAVAGLDSENTLDSFETFADRQSGYLAKAGSGVDISSYPLPLKLFTFWFRPLFVDAPGALGIFVSFENLFYLLLALQLLDKDFIPFLKNSPSLVKMSLVIFIAASIALSFVMSNLGIAMRQKSMVMYFLFFVIISFMEYKKQKKINLMKLKRRKLEEHSSPVLPIHPTPTLP
ncbi:hypothetical protein [uncultured Pontibacter sp.]|uniref:hypothetical protein n=1 Tax=uncultured Pontibacter sp. TaxID=453356 RepID=UPI002638D938|nr:hypothetical protein [uncultured Pontibacter sp.]